MKMVGKMSPEIADDLNTYEGFILTAFYYILISDTFKHLYPTKIYITYSKDECNCGESQIDEESGERKCFIHLIEILKVIESEGYRDEEDIKSLIIYIISHEMGHLAQGAIDYELYATNSEYNKFLEMWADNIAIKSMVANYSTLIECVGNFSIDIIDVVSEHLDEYMKERGLNNNLSIVERINKEQ